MAKAQTSQGRDVIKRYVDTRKELLQYFHCEEEYYIKPMTDYFWNIKADGDFHFLRYWKAGQEKPQDVVVVRRGGEPLLYRTDRYTMVIGIDCIKTGFLFHNGNKRNPGGEAENS